MFNSIHPNHMLAMRSLNRRHSAGLMDSLQPAGWVMLPSRQIYLVADVAKQSLSRRDSKNDQKVWRDTHLDYQELAQISAADADRSAALDRLLYINKYSTMNPAFTPAFVQLTHDLGLIKYLVFRARSGLIQVFLGGALSTRQPRRNATHGL